MLSAPRDWLDDIIVTAELYESSSSYEKNLLQSLRGPQPPSKVDDEDDGIYCFQGKAHKTGSIPRL
jgi:hypothetical protein